MLQCYYSSKSNKSTVSVSLRIQSECGKIQTIKTPNMNTFHAVCFHCSQDIRGAFSGLTEFSATESPINIDEKCFPFYL